MSLEEYDEWVAFYSVEPFGSPVEDERVRNLLALQYSAAGGKDEVVWLDRDPEWTAELASRVSPDLDHKLESFFEGRIAGQADDPAP